MTARRWTVTLYNQLTFEQSSATRSTRRAAFDAAWKRASPACAYGQLAARCASGSYRGMAVTWLAAFNDTVAYMRRGCTRASHTDPRGFCVSVERTL